MKKHIIYRTYMAFTIIHEAILCSPPLTCFIFLMYSRFFDRSDGNGMFNKTIQRKLGSA